MSVNDVGSSAVASALSGISETPSFLTHMGSLVVILTYSQSHGMECLEPNMATQIASSYNEPPHELYDALKLCMIYATPLEPIMICVIRLGALSVVDFFPCWVRCAIRLHRYWWTTLNQRYPMIHVCNLACDKHSVTSLKPFRLHVICVRKGARYQSMMWVPVRLLAHC